MLLLIRLSEAFPPLLKNTDKQLEKNLKLLSATASSAKYTTFSFAFAMCAAIISILFLSLLSFPLLFALPLAAISFIFSLLLPSFDAKLKLNKIDSSLPFSIYSLESELANGINPSIALKELRHFPALKSEYEQIVHLISKGAPADLLPKLVVTPSENFSKILQLTLNNDCEALKKFRADLAQENKNKSKQSAAKANLLGTFFIGVAAVLPALFSAIALLGQVVGFTLTIFQIIFAFIILFPLFDASILYYLELNTFNEN